MKKKKVKKTIGWAILAAMIVGILAVPILDMGWGDKLIILVIILALSGIIYWAMDAITED